MTANAGARRSEVSRCFVMRNCKHRLCRCSPMAPVSLLNPRLSVVGFLQIAQMLVARRGLLDGGRIADDQQRPVGRVGQHPIEGWSSFSQMRVFRIRGVPLESRAQVQPTGDAVCRKVERSEPSSDVKIGSAVTVQRQQSACSILGSAH